MKQCPQCKNTYTDDNLFCLNDGTALEFAQSYSGDMPTVVIPTGALPVPQQPVRGQNQNNWLFPVVGVLGALVLIMGFLLFYKFGSNEKQPESATVKQEATKQTPAPTPSETPTPLAPPVKIAPPAPVYLPAQSRVKFGKGKLSANVTGLVPAGANRSLVLACRVGQYLSASISSPGGCVSFVNGGANTEAYTISGDNFIYIKNTCSGDGSFNMNIFIK